MKKKTIGLLALALTGVLVLTACGSSAKKKAEQGNTNAAGGNTADNGTANNAADNTVTDNTAADNAGTADNTAADNAGAADNTVADNTGTADDTAADNTAAQEDSWSGTYIGNDESVTITQTGDSSISFSFAQSGISGSAERNGSQAVYKGDDSHVIVFNLNSTVLDVSVSSEEDFDASESPLNGTYIREG